MFKRAIHPIAERIASASKAQRGLRAALDFGLAAYASGGAWRAELRRQYRKKKKESAGKPGSVVDSHSSRHDVAAVLKQPTRERRGPRHCPPIWSCSRWGLPSHATLSPRAVRSYRTVSPSPRTTSQVMGRSAVCSLLHFPSAHAAQALPGTLPCGARTFLAVPKHVATAWPTPACIVAGIGNGIGRTGIGNGESSSAGCGPDPMTLAPF